LFKNDYYYEINIIYRSKSMLPEVLRLEGLAVEQPGGSEGQPSLGPLCVALEAPSFKGGDADAFLFCKGIRMMNKV
jgi:hypothetical protein